ncbi:MAG: hypothetical protein JST52_02565 [Bacteroidetes bacterium]|nr:hypothetical protein [Bacteroidota bacterium]MBS1740147.1 hypothetical protein [Bacteroidota bacterium]
MKKITAILGAVSLTVLATIVHAQGKKGESDAAFERGDKVFGVGLGVGTAYTYYGSHSYSYSVLPALALIYDQGLIDKVGPGNIGIGGMVAWQQTNYKYGNGDKANWTNFYLGIRGTYHLTILKEKNNHFDPYGGASFGMRVMNYNDTRYNESYHTTYPTIGLFVGARYYFTPLFAAFAEVGYDVAVLKLGVNLRIK